MRKGILLSLLFLCTVMLESFAQQSSLFSQYMFNGLAINPGYAGSHDVLSATVSGRKQWLGVEGAPATMTFGVHTPLKKEKIAVGVLFYSDKIGIFSQQSLNTIYAYKIKVSSTGHLSFGLQASINNYVARYTQLTSKDPNDPSLIKDDVVGFAPSFGTGIYYYTEKFYAGLSSPFLINNLIGQQVYNNLKIRSTYFFTSGRVFDISQDVKIKPSVLIKYVYGAPIQADLNTNVLFKNVLWIGASLRNFSAVNFLTQFNVTHQLKIGYSYDVNLTSASPIYSGSHEVMISYLFSFDKSRVVTPRNF